MRSGALAVALLVALGSGCTEKSAPKGEPFPSPAPSALEAPKPFPTPPGATPKPEVPKDLNVLFVTIDALRADMPWTGYPRPIAPRLTKLAAESVVYTRAYALSSYTSMSLGGLMAGRYPSELPRNGLATSHFGAEATMLAEVLAQAGVRSIGVHGHVYFAGDTGIQQGFDDWRLVPKITSRPAREGHVVDADAADLMMSALGEHATKHPKERFFAWVHFMDPHAIYAPHEGLRFTGSPYAPDAGLDAVAPPGVPLNDIGQGLRNRYDAEVAFSDAQLGRLLDYVEKQPWGKHTAIVVSADHGEAFGEHKSYFEHGNLLFDVTTRVPLLFCVPGLAPARIDARRSHIDLARTLFELFGVAAPASFRGTSLVPELLGARPPEREIVIDMPYTDQTPRRRALIRSGLKLTVTETEEQPTLFDLNVDPSERTDLVKSRPKDVAEMKKRWDEVDAALPDYPAPRKARGAY